ncbi:hypothetical protein OGATHE_002402 [Ogataea polymorpha]|uniref:Uncharacterized protein n=1 Tax=Ogataea polymorpha TaxID=460523 RepID=A0A9P8T8U2_9ASCO|nr:hypothetical protein OGATHE_002402 [Ogataea polymorpha]
MSNTWSTALTRLSWKSWPESPKYLLDQSRRLETEEEVKLFAEDSSESKESLMALNAEVFNGFSSLATKDSMLFESEGL